MLESDTAEEIVPNVERSQKEVRDTMGVRWGLPLYVVPSPQPYGWGLTLGV